MATKKKRKAKRIWMRYRKGDVLHNLMCSVQRFVHDRNGDVLLMGPVQIIDGSREGNFTVGLSCTGRRPYNSKQT